MKLGETVSLAEGGFRMEDDPVKLETEVTMQVKQSKGPTQAGVSIGHVQNDNSRVGGSSSRRDLGLVEGQKLVTTDQLCPGV